MDKLSWRALLFWAWLCLAHGLAAAAEPCDEKQERCADRGMARKIIELLTPAEQTFVAIADGHSTRALPIAAAELIWQRVRSMPDSTPEMRAVAAGRLIDAYLAGGMSSEAIELFESLDRNVRERVVGGPVFGRSAEISGNRFYFEQLPAKTAVGLAVAFFDSGRIEDANRLLDIGARAEHDPSPQGRRRERFQEAVACGRILINANDRTDWFSWVFGDSLNDAELGGCARLVKARAYARLAARRLEASGLPERWRIGVEPNAQPEYANSRQSALDEALEKLPTIASRIGKLAAILAAIDDHDARWIALEKRLGETRRSFRNNSVEDAEPSSADKELARTLTDRLERTLFNPYRIEAAQIKPASAKAAAANVCGRGVIRCVDVRQVRWELLVSKDYDPSGEVPAAGYWLRRTELPDGPPRRFYLGLKEHMPFELVDSTEPFIVADELRLLVRRSEIDPKTITFPPLGLQFQGDNTVLEVRASLEEIMKDTDGDGLTDLAEQQLLLDPNNPDSDGDGILDGEDPMPNVKFTAKPTPRQRALAAGLAFVTREPDGAISFAVPGADSFVRRVTTDERTLFVIADAEDVAGMSSGRRIIVLPMSLDLEVLKKHPAFSVFFPLRIALHTYDDGTHAELEYSAGWQGGTLAMELRDGVWRIGRLSGWIT